MGTDSRSTDPSVGVTTPAHRALIVIANDVMASRPGERLRSGKEYQSLIGVGSGTVRKAISELTRAGAVRTVTKGHQGTVIIDRDVGRLWGLSGRPPLRIAITPPGAADVLGLERALRSETVRLGLFDVTSHIRGARRRVAQLLKNEVDVVVLSVQAAKAMSRSQRRQVTVTPLSKVHYYHPDLIGVVKRAGTRYGPLTTVGVDRDSQDHVELTRLAFGADAVLHDCNFPYVPREILEGRLDMGVWHRVESIISPEHAGLEVIPLRSWLNRDVPEGLLGAALVTRIDDAASLYVVEELDIERMAADQAQLVGNGVEEETTAQTFFS